MAYRHGERTPFVYDQVMLEYQGHGERGETGVAGQSLIQVLYLIGACFRLYKGRGRLNYIGHE
jgi:hypothetical protein